MAEKERQSKAMQIDQKVPDIPPSGGPTHAVFPLELQGAIGKQLKQVYGQMLAEPLPDKFSKLLDQLSKSDKK